MIRRPKGRPEGYKGQVRNVKFELADHPEKIENIGIPDDMKQVSLTIGDQIVVGFMNPAALILQTTRENPSANIGLEFNPGNAQRSDMPSNYLHCAILLMDEAGEMVEAFPIYLEDVRFEDLKNTLI